jgi:hypothetical protein
MKVKVSAVQATTILSSAFGGGGGITPASPVVLYVTKLNMTQQQYVSAFLLIGATGLYSGFSVSVGTAYNTWFELTDDTLVPATLLAMSSLVVTPVDGIED